MIPTSQEPGECPGYSPKWEDSCTQIRTNQQPGLWQHVEAFKQKKQAPDATWAPAGLL